MTFFPTSNPALNEEVIATITPNDRDDLLIQIDNLKAENIRLDNNVTFWRDKAQDLERKISNVKGHLEDIHSSEGELDENFMEVARLLNLDLMKEFNVSVTVTFTGTARVPLSMNEDDFYDEVSFSFDEGYSDVEWDMDEDDVSWDVQESY